MVSEIQSILFDRKEWTSSDALEWLYSHNLKPQKKAHFTKEKIRFRLHDPMMYDRLRIKKFRNGIEIIFGFN